MYEEMVMGETLQDDLAVVPDVVDMESQINGMEADINDTEPARPPRPETPVPVFFFTTPVLMDASQLQWIPYNAFLPIQNDQATRGSRNRRRHRRHPYRPLDDSIPECSTPCPRSSPVTTETTLPNDPGTSTMNLGEEMAIQPIVADVQVDTAAALAPPLVSQTRPPKSESPEDSVSQLTNELRHCCLEADMELDKKQ